MSKIKICGIKREADIDYINEALPDYMGFVFAKSKRQISFLTAAKLRAKLDQSVTPVGVFVNAPVDEICSLYQEGIIAMAQLHGQEDASYIETLREKIDCPVIKALKIDKDFDCSILSTLDVDYFLFDNGAGGTGKMFDWNFIPKTEKPFFLAGGLNIQNIDAAIAKHPFAVDISSGVEVDGRKDRKKILEIVKRIRNNL